VGLFLNRGRVFLRAAVWVAAALTGAAVAAGPASAAPGVSVQLSPTSFDLKGGDSRSLTVKVTNSGPLARISLTVAAPTGLSGDVTVASSDSSCSGSGSTVSCTVDILGNGQKSVVFTLTVRNPDSLAAGQSRTDTSGTVSTTTPGGSSTLGYAVTLHGPAQSPTRTPTPAGSSRAASSPTTGTTIASGAAAGTAGPASGTPQPASASTDVTVDPSGSDAGTAEDGMASAGSDGVFWLLVGFGALLALAGVAIIAALVVRHRRDRTRQPWPAPAVATTDPSNAPVDPWDPHPDYH
jgi:hypothetical protein